MPEFTPKEVEKASKACTAICMWVRAMHKYHHVARAVEPKKKMLAEAQIALDETLAKLADAQSRLKVRIHYDRVHRRTGVCVWGGGNSEYALKGCVSAVVLFIKYELEDLEELV